MLYFDAAITTKKRPLVNALVCCLLLSTGPLVVGLPPTALVLGENLDPQMIAPGIGIGPARLGMAEAQARKVLEASHLTRPECNVDIFLDHGRVIALGTRFGGCLALPLPPRVARVTISGGILIPETGGIGGSPAPLARAFGNASRFPLESGIAILLWPNGLLAQTTTTDAGEMITYLAVVPANSRVPPYTMLIP